MTSRATQTIPVYSSAHFSVVHGVAEGDALSFMDELVMDDIYHLSRDAQRNPLTYATNADGTEFRIETDSEAGTPGNILYLDCCITLMARDGATLEALILVEVEDGEAVEVHLLPLVTLQPEQDYRLVGADRDSVHAKLGQVAFVSFTRGTHITMATGIQTPVEDLKVGDRVLTRDAGPQEIRWIGESTQRSVGDFSPVVIKAGALSNSRDLIISPDHRLFIYQRQDQIGAGRSEILIKARHLINGTTVIQQEGGFTDYFQLLFDDHQIIYAEGIATESLLLDSRTRAALPADLSAQLNFDHEGKARAPGFELDLKDLGAVDSDMVKLLKKASSS